MTAGSSVLEVRRSTDSVGSVGMEMPLEPVLLLRTFELTLVLFAAAQVLLEHLILVVTDALALLVEPLFHELARLLLVLSQAFQVSAHMHLINLELADRVADPGLLLGQLDLLEGDLVRLGLTEHLHFDHLLGDLLLLKNLVLLELSELFVPHLVGLTALDGLVLDLLALLLILGDKSVELTRDLCLLLLEDNFGLGKVLVSATELNCLFL